jgi:hypothetical protein
LPELLTPAACATKAGRRDAFKQAHSELKSLSPWEVEELDDLGQLATISHRAGNRSFARSAITSNRLRRKTGVRNASATSGTDMVLHGGVADEVQGAINAAQQAADLIAEDSKKTDAQIANELCSFAAAADSSTQLAIATDGQSSNSAFLPYAAPVHSYRWAPPTDVIAKARVLNTE